MILTIAEHTLTGNRYQLIESFYENAEKVHCLRQLGTKEEVLVPIRQVRILSMTWMPAEKFRLMQSRNAYT